MPIATVNPATGETLKTFDPLGPEEIERLGRGLMDLESTIRRLQAQFEIDDLNLDLGPIGRLLDE